MRTLEKIQKELRESIADLLLEYNCDGERVAQEIYEQLNESFDVQLIIKDWRTELEVRRKLEESLKMKLGA